jgi:arginine deiminase
MRGIVMGRLRSSQRQREVALMRLCFQKLGLPIIGEISQPGFLEGGDFFPAGADLALIGIGLRSNMEACEQLMEQNLLGTRCLAVVKDDFDRHQVRSLSPSSSAPAFYMYLPGPLHSFCPLFLFF